MSECTELTFLRTSSLSLKLSKVTRTGLVPRTSGPEYTRLALCAEKSWKNQKQSIDRLKSTLRQIIGRVDEAKREYALLTARQETAETSKLVSQTLASIPDGSVGQLMEALDDKVSGVEAHAEAVEEVFGRDKEEKQ